MNLEALIDAEAGRQPAHNLFILSCAIPAGIGTFGGLSVFVAWISGNSGLPLLLGTVATAILAAGAWFIFYRLYRDIPPAKRHLRDLILKFGKRYGSFGNIMLGEQVISDEFGALLDEAAGIYLRYCAGEGSLLSAVPAKAENAIEDAMSRLLEVAVLNDRAAQNLALAWAQPMLHELRLLDQSLMEHAKAAKLSDVADPLATLRDARSELDTNIRAVQELDEHVRAN